jgi:hypothetical protein
MLDWLSPEDFLVRRLIAVTLFALALAGLVSMNPQPVKAGGLPPPLCGPGDPPSTCHP